MSFTLAIRGIPNFANLQHLEVGSFEEIFSKFTIKGREGWPNNHFEFFNKDSKRVSLYIDPTEHDTETITKMCSVPGYRGGTTNFWRIYPHEEDPHMLRAAGSGLAAPGEWQALTPTVWPTYAQAKQELQEKINARVQAQSLLDKQEEEREEALNDALEGALSRVGHEAVVAALESL